MTEMRASILLQRIDRMTGPAKVATRAVEQMNRAGRGIQDWVRDANSRFEAMEDRLARLGQATLIFDQMQRAGRGLTSVFGVTTRAAMSFEDAMVEVKKVADFESPVQLKTFERDLRRLASVRGMPAVERLAEIAAAGAQNGIPLNELNDFVRLTAQASVSFDGMEGDAGRSIGTMRRNFKLTNQGVNDLLGSVNELGNKTGAAAAPIIDVLERAGAQGKQIGLTGQQVAALGATMLESGTRADVAGTGLNTFFQFMVLGERRTKKFGASMAQLGLNADAFADKMKRDPNRALTEVLEAVSKSEEQTAILFDLFGAEYADDIGRLANAYDGLRKNQRLADNQTVASPSLQKEFNAAAERTSAGLRQMFNAIKDVAIAAGAPFLSFIDQMTGAVTAAATSVSKFIETFPVLSSVLLGAVGGLGGLLIAVGALGSALITTAGFVALMGWSLKTLGVSALFSSVRLWGVAAAQYGIAAAGKVMMAVRAVAYLVATQGAAATLTMGLVVLKGAVIGVAKSLLAVVVPALRVLGAAILSNPIGLFLAVIAAGAAAIVINWETVKTWFAAFGRFVAHWAGKALSAFTSVFGFNPMTLIAKAWSGLKGWFATLFDGVSKGVQMAMDRVTGFIMGPINRLKELLGLKRESELGLSDREAASAGRALARVSAMYRDGRLQAAAAQNGWRDPSSVPLAGLDAASGVGPRPPAPPVTADQRTQTFNITQLPGEDSAALARRIADEAERRERRGFYDGE